MKGLSDCWRTLFGHSSSDFNNTVSTYDVSRAISAALNERGASNHAISMAFSAATIFSTSFNSSILSTLTFNSSKYIARTNLGFTVSHRWWKYFANVHGRSCRFSNIKTSFSSSALIN